MNQEQIIFKKNKDQTKQLKQLKQSGQLKKLEQLKLKVQISQKKTTEKKGYQYYFKKNDTSIDVPFAGLNKKHQSKTMNYIKYENFQKMKRTGPNTNFPNNSAKGQRSSEPLNFNKRNSMYSSSYVPTNARHESFNSKNPSQLQKPKYNTPQSFQIIPTDQPNPTPFHPQQKIQEFQPEDKLRLNRFQQNSRKQSFEQADKKQQITKKFQSIDLRHKAKHINNIIDQSLGKVNISWSDNNNNGGLSGLGNNQKTKVQKNKLNQFQSTTTIEYFQKINNNFTDIANQKSSQNTNVISGVIIGEGQQSHTHKAKLSTRQLIIRQQEEIDLNLTKSLEIQLKELEAKRQSNLDQILRQQKFIKQLQVTIQQQKSIFQEKSIELVKTNIKYQTLGKAYNDLQQKHKDLQTLFSKKLQSQTLKTKKDLQQRLQTSTQKIQKYLSQICKLNKKIQEQEQIHKENEKQLILRYEKQKEQIKNKNKQEIDKKIQLHKQQIVNINKYYQQKEKKLTELQKLQIQRIKEKQTEVLEKVKLENKSQIALLIEQHQKKIDNLTRLAQIKHKQYKSTISFYQSQLQSIPSLKQTVSYTETQLVKQKTHKLSIEKQLSGYKLYVEELKKLNKISDTKHKQKQAQFIELQKNLLQTKSKLQKKQKEFEELENLLNVVKKEGLENQTKLKTHVDEIEKLKIDQIQSKSNDIKKEQKINFLQAICNQFKNYDEVEYEIIQKKLETHYKNPSSSLILFNSSIKSDLHEQDSESYKQQSSISPSTSLLTNMKLKKKISLVDRNLQLERDLHVKKNECETHTAKLKQWQTKYNQLLGSKHEDQSQFSKKLQITLQQQRFKLQQSHKTQIQQYISKLESLTQQILLLQNLKTSFIQSQSSNLTKITELETQVSVMSNQIKQAKQIAQNYKEKHQILQNQIQVLEGLIECKQIENSNVKEQAMKLETNLREVREKVERLESEEKEKKKQNQNQISKDKQSNEIHHEIQIKTQEIGLAQQQKQKQSQKLPSTQQTSTQTEDKGLQQQLTHSYSPEQESAQPFSLHLHHQHPSLPPHLHVQIQYLTKIEQFYNEVLEVFGLQQLDYVEIVKIVNQLKVSREKPQKNLKNGQSCKNTSKTEQTSNYHLQKTTQHTQKKLNRSKSSKLNISSEQNENEIEAQQQQLNQKHSQKNQSSNKFEDQARNNINNTKSNLTQFDYEEKNQEQQQNALNDEAQAQDDPIEQESNQPEQNGQIKDQSENDEQNQLYPDQQPSQNPNPASFHSLYTKISSNQQELLHIVNQWIRKLERQAFSINQYKEKSIFLEQKFKQSEQQISLLSQQKIQICEKYEMLVNKFEQENGELEEKLEEAGQKHADMEAYIKEVQELLHEANKKCMTYGLFGLEICKRECLGDDLKGIFQDHHNNQPDTFESTQSQTINQPCHQSDSSQLTITNQTVINPPQETSEQQHQDNSQTIIQQENNTIHQPMNSTRSQTSQTQQICCQNAASEQSAIEQKPQLTVKVQQQETKPDQNTKLSPGQVPSDNHHQPIDTSNKITNPTQQTTCLQPKSDTPSTDPPSTLKQQTPHPSITSNQQQSQQQQKTQQLPQPPQPPSQLHPIPAPKKPQSQSQTILTQSQPHQQKQPQPTQQPPK